MALSRLAREFAAEIALQDWSDAPYRIDRAGHSREHDNQATEQLTPQQTDCVRTNVMWVVGQVLGHADPNFNMQEWAKACGVDLHPGWVAAGFRAHNGQWQVPGTYDFDPGCDPYEAMTPPPPPTVSAS